MIKWIRPKDQMPPQGKKILWLLNGDCCVVQRIADYWLPIPFIESKYADYREPDYWADIEMPDGLTGRIRIIPDNSFYALTIDELEQQHPEVYKKFVDDWKNLYLNSAPKVCMSKS